MLGKISENRRFDFESDIANLMEKSAQNEVIKDIMLRKMGMLKNNNKFV
jgi:hypothetical protein